MRALNVSLVFLMLLIVLPVLVGVYVYRDARRRGMNAGLWTLIAIVAPSLIGFLVYLLVRGNYTDWNCARCGTAVKERFVVCPKCGAKLRPACPACLTPVEADWAVCPKCAGRLPDIQNDIVAPVRPKDTTLWKILAAIVFIPAMMIFAAAVLFSVNSGSASFCEVSVDSYFADEELPQSTKDYVREWMDNLPEEENRVYALRFRYQVLEESKEKDYYYLIYIPGCGSVSSNSFGYSAGLFGGEIRLELNGNGPEESFYCMMISEKKQAPGIRVVLNGRRLEDVVTVVDFNPTLYTIATEDDYSMLTEVSGAYDAEGVPVELKPTALAIIKYENGQELDAVKYDAPDILLNAVVKIHELTAMRNPPLLQGEEIYADCYKIGINFMDASGETAHEDTVEYFVVWYDNAYYLTDDAQKLVYQIDEQAYAELEMLF